MCLTVHLPLSTVLLYTISYGPPTGSQCQLLLGWEARHNSTNTRKGRWEGLFERTLRWNSACQAELQKAACCVALQARGSNTRHQVLQVTPSNTASNTRHHFMYHRLYEYHWVRNTVLVLVWHILLSKCIFIPMPFSSFKGHPLLLGYY